MQSADSFLDGKTLSASSVICAVISVLHQLKGIQLYLPPLDDDTLNEDNELSYLIQHSADGLLAEMDTAHVAGIGALEKLAMRIIRLFTTDVCHFFGFSSYPDGKVAVRSLFESEYVSDVIGNGSCAAILLFRILQLVRLSEDHEWDGWPVYTYRLSPTLWNEVTMFFMHLKSLPRGRIGFVSDRHAVVLIACACEPPFGLIPSTALPKSPSVYSVRTTVDSQAQSDCRTNDQPAFTFHRHRRAAGHTPPNHQSDSQSSITENWVLDLCILQYLTPSDLHAVQQVNAYYHTLVESHCAVPLGWSKNFMLHIRHFFRKEWGRVHLRLGSWIHGN